MVRTPGAISQDLMKESPAQRNQLDYTFPLRGLITLVTFKDSPSNTTNQTLVNVGLLDGYPLITDVPLAYPYISKENGEEETPEIGSMVLVQFIAGSFRRPVVTGFLAPPKADILAATADAPRSRRTRNGTSETIEKDGTRRVHVAKDEVVEITGDGTMKVLNGDLTISVETGNISLTSNGKTTIQGNGTVEIIGSEGGVPKGIVTGDCTCMYSGKPHPVVSLTVKASL